MIIYQIYRFNSYHGEINEKTKNSQPINEIKINSLLYKYFDKIGSFITQETFKLEKRILREIKKQIKGK